LGTHFSDLSNILLNGAEVELEELDWLAVPLAGATGLAAELVLGVLILRFWKAFRMPPFDGVLAATRDAEEDDEEEWLQLC